jgi:alanine dehydrogenase
VRRQGKRDGNHAEIVKGLRDAGATVQDLGAVGKGCPDILVGFRGQSYVIEIKDGRLPPSARELTDDQKKWHAEWKGQKAVALNLFDALKIIGAVEISGAG